MGNLRTWMSLAAIALLIELVVAANLTVGGPNGWDTTTNLQSWESSQTFAMGDNLIFQYTALHSVLEVTKADYDACQTTSPQKSYSGGNTIITLASPGKRYFICGTPGHCSSGMKLEVNAVAPAATPPTSPPSSTPPTSPPSLPPPSSPPPSPKIPPSVAPAPPIKESPAPGSSPTVPSSSPSLAPSDTTPASPSPTGVTPRPSPSAANGNNSLLKLAVGFGSGLVLLLAI